MSIASKPPFRADQVGSLLRPQRLLEKRDAWRQGNISSQELKEIEDQEISKVIDFQQEIGLKAITDGEFRRDYWHLDFICAFDGIELNEETYGHAFSGGGTVSTFKVAGKIGNNNGFMREHIGFVLNKTKEVAKFCIPAPGMTFLRSGRSGIDRDIYPDLDEFWEDVIRAYSNEVQELYKLGCRYLQFDDVSFAYLCDSTFREDILERGDNPDELIKIFGNAISRCVAEKPSDMVITTHMCRGNFQSTWMTSGGYEPVAEIMFDNLDTDGFFMEYDSDRAGGFEPLRFANKNQTIILGLVSSKIPTIETKDEIKRRIEEAEKYIPIENLCLSPQCGFSSTHHGNNLSVDDQRKKLELVVEVADEVWGGS
tara:strand:+ start:2508 stop:3614 length:1107 start_codon:yes stop_codon:yes gene_type:complete